MSTLDRDTPGYRADLARRKSVYQLAGGLGLAAVMTMVPALGYWNLAAAPAWAQAVLLLAALQLGYAIWLALVPDWSSVWVGMIASTIIAVVYAAAMAIHITAQADSDLVLDFGELRRARGSLPAVWCGAVVLVNSALAYTCGVVSHRWKKAWAAEKTGTPPTR